VLGVRVGDTDGGETALCGLIVGGGTVGDCDPGAEGEDPGPSCCSFAKYTANYHRYHYSWSILSFSCWVPSFSLTNPSWGKNYRNSIASAPSQFHAQMYSGIYFRSSSHTVQASWSCVLDVSYLFDSTDATSKVCPCGTILVPSFRTSFEKAVKSRSLFDFLQNGDTTLRRGRQFQPRNVLGR
jgi:hypothetical protein